MDRYNRLLEELEYVLRSVRLQHFEPYVMREFSETSWNAVKYMVKRQRMPLRSSSIAKVLRTLVMNCSLDEEQLVDRIAIVRLLAVALNGTKEWHTYQLSSPNNELRLVTPTTLAVRVGRTLVATSRRGTVPEVHSLKHVDSYFFSVALRSSSTQKCSPPVYFVKKPDTTILFASRKPSPSLMKPICKAIGYDNHKDVKLKGKDLPSLYRILEQKHNKPISAVTGLPEYAPMPELTPTGIDYTDTTYNDRYVDGILGDNPPLLNTVQIDVSEPYFDAESQGMDDTPMHMRIEIRSPNIALTLKDMVKRKVIPANSMWLNFFQETKRNQIKLKSKNNNLYI